MLGYQSAMSKLLDLGRIILIAFAVLFGLGWLAFFFFLLRRVFLVLSGRSDLRSATLDPKLLFLRRFLIGIFLGALVTGLLCIALAGIQG